MSRVVEPERQPGSKRQRYSEPRIAKLKLRTLGQLTTKTNPNPFSTVHRIFNPSFSKPSSGFALFSIMTSLTSVLIGDLAD